MRARAKLNLFLHVDQARSDGYHPLYSLVAFADAGDEIVCEVSDTLSLEINGPFADELTSDLSNNLILRAAERLRDLAEGVGHSVPGAKITLTKNLPIASGIGGGSTDAAATIKTLMDLWGFSPSQEKLSQLALSLGADVPVCLFGNASIMSGIGEVIVPAPSLPPVWCVLVNPGVSISTAKIFSAFDQNKILSPLMPMDTLPDKATFEDLIVYLKQTRNDLEPLAKAEAPIIEEVLGSLSQNNAAFVRMSGSGATCFGLFLEESQARECANTISSQRPDWWVKPSRLG